MCVKLSSFFGTKMSLLRLIPYVDSIERRCRRSKDANVVGNKDVARSNRIPSDHTSLCRPLINYNYKFLEDISG